MTQATKSATKAPKLKPSPPTDEQHLFALKAWTIKQSGGKFFISPTAYFDNKPDWRGPYATVRDATTAIARKLEAEFTERRNRLTAFHTAQKSPRR